MTDYRDPKLRELTFKVIHMAPEAPPFPEVAITTLKPHKQSTSSGGTPPRRNWTALAFAAGAFGLALLVALPIWLLRGGEPEPTNPSSTTVTTTVVSTTAPPPVDAFPIDVTLYYVADYVESSNLPGPHLVPVKRTVEVQADEVTQSLALGAAMAALFEGPSTADGDLFGDIASSIPAGTELVGFSISADGTRAELDFNAEFESGGGSFSMMSRLAQVVYTATSVEGIEEVAFFIEGEPVTTFSGEGIVLDGPQGRDGYTDLLPLIFVDAPLAGSTVESPVTVRGLANTFEATLLYRLQTAGGEVLSEGFTTATCGTGCWGEYEIVLEYALEQDTAGFLVVYEASAQDGSAVNVVTVPLQLSASESPGGEASTELQVGLPGSPPLNGAVTTEPSITISGTTTATEVTINGEAIALDGGAFTHEVDLVAGTNEITIDDGTATVYTVSYVPDGTVEFAFLREVSADEIVADYAQWLTGEEADRAAIEDGFIEEGESVPNGYYIRNQNTQLRTLPLDPAFNVNLPTAASGPVENVIVSVTGWLGLFKDDGTPWDLDAGDEPPVWEEPHFGYFGAGLNTFGYWLTMNEDGEVLQVTGQYTP